MSDTPGRSCPLHYHYGAGELAGATELDVDIAWIVGGLYGNVDALHAIQHQVERERADGHRVALVFNGDAHWFDTGAEDFAAIEAAMGAEHAIAGNVELELAQPDPDAGCGCAYPESVDDATVERSNRIIERLRATADAQPGVRERLAALPRLLRLRIGDTVTGVVHGDPESVAGWRFAIENAPRLQSEQVAAWATDGDVGAFACSHTCLPWAATFNGVVVINNGSAGMPNFRGDPRVVVTRIAGEPRPHPQAIYGHAHQGTRWEAVAVTYDSDHWWQRFLQAWPEGSDAHASYARRILEGPEFAPEDATPVIGDRLNPPTVALA